jgi:hypothetical protein
MKIKRGSTSVRRLIFIGDSSSTTGAGLANLTHNSSGLVCYYFAGDLSDDVQVSLVAPSGLGSYTSGGFVAVDNTNMPGWYEIGIPNAALDGGNEVAIQLRGATNMAPVNIYIELDSVDYQDSAAFGLSKFADIETDTQNIQSRLPASLTGGRIDSSVGAFQSGVTPTNFASMSIDSSGRVWLQPTQTGVTIPTVQTVELVNELGNTALSANALDESIAILTWQQLTTATWPTDSFGKQVLIGSSTQRSVAVTGSHHVASVVHDAEPNSIPEDAFTTGALSARVLAADAATEIATAVGTLQVLTRLDSMIESDGAGQFRFDTIALENAPSGGGGGGGGTDWTSSERSAIRSILGFNSSGTIVDPSVGILDEIRDGIGGSSAINVYPVSSSTPERVAGTTLTFYRDESRSVSVVTDFTLTSLTLRFVVEDNDGNDVLVIENAAINKSQQTFTVSITTAVTANLGNYRWSMRDITTGNSVIAFGVLTVQEAASKDA